MAGHGIVSGSRRNEVPMGGGSGTLAETSDNSMTTYRTQETDPFGSASLFFVSDELSHRPNLPRTRSPSRTPDTHAAEPPTPHRGRRAASGGKTAYPMLTKEASGVRLPLPAPTAVGCSLRKVRWTVSLFAHDPPAAEPTIPHRGRCEALEE